MRTSRNVFQINTLFYFKDYWALNNQVLKYDKAFQNIIFISVPKTQHTYKLSI